ncbi:hypothetical protein [Asaia sp. HN010]|uniref:hypothetical protein n=1 Tax=Asaia sp. HN010 TaxID=3081233 RepID=UPI0030198E36
MSAVSRLWRRAPVWRFFLYAGGFFLVLGLIFPTPFITRHTGWAHALTRYLPSFGSSPDKGEAESAAGSSTSPGQGSPDGQGNDLSDPARFITPDISAALTGAIPFGGHNLPLPAGVWHPVLSGQYGPNERMLLNVLVRTDRGIVTGVMIASTTNQDVPLDVVEDAYNHCHDDRNYHSAVLAERPDGETECTYVAPAFMGANNTTLGDTLLQLAFKRLTTLGFPMPSVFVNASWLYNRGAGARAKGTTSVMLLIAPTQPGTVVLRAPLPFWDKRMISQSRPALDFVRRVDIWFTDWAAVLHQGMVSDYTGAAPDAHLAKDPSAP